MTSTSLSRRTLLRAGAGVVGAAALVTTGSSASASPIMFGHGVASGDPLPDAVIL